MTDTPLQRTPLYDVHRALGAKMVPFAGWEMPVQYPGGILAEHRAVREGAGIFDVCHMGKFEVTGPDRNAFVNRITTETTEHDHCIGLQRQGATNRRGARLVGDRLA